MDPTTTRGLRWDDKFHRHHGYTASSALPNYGRESERLVDYPSPFWLNLFQSRKTLHEYLSTQTLFALVVERNRTCPSTEVSRYHA